MVAGFTPNQVCTVRVRTTLFEKSTKLTPYSVLSSVPRYRCIAIIELKKIRVTQTSEFRVKTLTIPPSLIMNTRVSAANLDNANSIGCETPTILCSHAAVIGVPVRTEMQIQATSFCNFP